MVWGNLGPGWFRTVKRCCSEARTPVDLAGYLGPRHSLLCLCNPLQFTNIHHALPIVHPTRDLCLDWGGAGGLANATSPRCAELSLARRHSPANPVSGALATL